MAKERSSRGVGKQHGPVGTVQPCEYRSATRLSKALRRFRYYLTPFY